jgi:FkbM family methyltransferase
MARAITLILEIAQTLFGDCVFTMRTGLAKGLKRRYGLGFKPKFSPTKEEEFLMRLDLQGKTVFDAGGYVGIYALFFARAVGKTGRVVTFEPNPRNYEELTYNIGLNSFDNITAMQIGLGRRHEQLDLVTDPIYPSRGTIKRGETIAGATGGSSAQMYSVRESPRKPVTRAFKVEVFSLDHLMRTGHLPKPDFVKIDVEGFEMDVLYGMVETIDNYKPDLLIEVHGEISREMIEILASKGYLVYHIESGVEITPDDFLAFEGGHLFCK